jgi:hypothetical protein
LLRMHYRLRRLVLLAAVICLGGVSASAAAAAAPPGSPMPPCNVAPAPNCLIATHPPTPGFDPLTATNAELVANGFPQRPNSLDPAVLAAWRNTVSHATHYVDPHPIVGSTYHNETSTNWAGHVVSTAVHSVSRYAYVQGAWIQPSVPGNSNYSNSNYASAPAASFWAGLGAQYLIQTGADSISTSTPQYKFWTEDYPAATVWEGPVIRPGDLAHVEATYNGNNTTTYWLSDQTTGAYSSFTNSSPYVGYTAANFINEKMNGLPLPNYGNSTFSSDYLGTSTSNIWALTTTNTHIDMVNSSGSIIVDGGSVNNSTAGFTTTWKGP